VYFPGGSISLLAVTSISSLLQRSLASVPGPRRGAHHRGVVAVALLSLLPTLSGMLSTSAIQIRDPFVLPVPEEQVYYLFGTTDKDCWGPVGTGFDAYRSADLEVWEGPLPAFRPPEGFWGERNFWAPECFAYEGRYYLFASFKAEGRARGTAILVAARPEGPYQPHSEGAVTPSDWECLDGTLHLDGEGQPWMVFCHEWVQIGDGAICAMRLSPDLKAATGEPRVLFHASAAPWSVSHRDRPGVFVTDGPFLHRTASGRLLMLWSTYGAEGYTMGLAYSESGTIEGPWLQHPEPLFRRDGGHGMVFRRFDGQLMVALHRPNRTPDERARFLLLEETSGGLLRIVASAGEAE
jgi:arabinan endo-1,5-alpha-L-arabinosidase